ncbi:(2,3-dihydroxybenzoyl)adenylate synthase (plasmid) [Azospirillum sp. TSH58]|uniref:(2,3-dihydroxybenzoyl)adenylate synthase n=1 Tax=Azospirillum sp. TSH58 TaxID=664962 RepID=UPI000D601ED4|nr:(2,3-dihydroxybenzoyl)adenylate synthase [Azospirillum sp. TSH58]AWJ86453.1 (2,3-dihydroxybenzoyl)adenylate synthase [Azospirillum sp. TSH58]PWC64064.1 enterobactin synthase subunit E [Azospirillum sp. TSH58]
MSVAFTPWPADFAERYRAKGYWTGDPLTDVIDRHRGAAAEATAILCGERRFRYADLQRLSSRLAAAFRARGLRPGDTALVRLPNRAEFYLVFFALLRCGVVPVNALNSHGVYELTAYARQIEPALAVLPAADPSLVALMTQTVGAERLLLLGPPADDGIGGFAWANGDALAQDAAGPDPSADLAADPSGVAFFQLSGGSTGTPKLIPRTHDDYLYSVRRSVEICGLDGSCRFLCALPAPHNFTLSSPGALGVFHAGGTVVMAGDPSPATCFPLIARHRVTWAALVPPMLSVWLEAAAGAEDLSSLEVVQVGGAKLSPAVAERVPERLGCRLQQVFGMAEGLVNYTRLDDDPWTVVNTQGRPMSPDDEIRILDAAGHPVPPGAVGELWTRGPYTFRGYYKAEAHNARVFDAEGFYCSGDLVSLTPGGNLVVCGRNKDQINRGGEKIDAQEVEDLLAAHPAVGHAAVVAMPDALMGERACAFVIAPPATKPSELRRFLRGQGLADFKLPDRFVFVPDLPKTAVGKVDKQTLRERARQDNALMETTAS